MIKNHDTGLMKKQPADKLVAHSPEFRQFIDGEMPLKRGLRECHSILPTVADP